MMLPSPDNYGNWKDWAQSLVRALYGSDRVVVLKVPHVISTRMPPASEDGLLAWQRDTGKLVVSIGGVWKAVTTEV